MYTKIYWLQLFANATKLGIMPRPRGGDWLDNEIANLEKHDVGVLVSLLQQDEIDELGLTAEQSLCLEHQIEYIHFPITDRDIPSSKHKTAELVNRLRKLLANGTSVVIHCRMGIGRSSIIAGAVLLNVGLTNDEIITEIEKSRGVKVPDTEEQLQWFKLLML